MYFKIKRNKKRKNNKRKEKKKEIKEIKEKRNKLTKWPQTHSYIVINSLNIELNSVTKPGLLNTTVAKE